MVAFLITNVRFFDFDWFMVSDHNEVIFPFALMKVHKQIWTHLMTVPNFWLGLLLITSMVVLKDIAYCHLTRNYLFGSEHLIQEVKPQNIVLAELSNAPLSDGSECWWVEPSIGAYGQRRSG